MDKFGLNYLVTTEFDQTNAEEANHDSKKRMARVGDGDRSRPRGVWRQRLISIRGGSGVSKGAISAFGSIFVNGVEFGVTKSSVTMNDSSKSTADLKLGMVVTVHGNIDDATKKGSATSIDFSDDLEGPACSVNTAAQTMSVFGQTVKIIASTKFDGFSNFSSVGNSIVEVSGLPDASGAITATFVEKKGQTDEFELKGYINNLDTTLKTFTLTLTQGSSGSAINYSGITLPSGIQNGSFVKVSLDPATVSCGATSYTATQISAKKAEMEDTAMAEMEGYVAGLNSAALTFKLNGMTVDYSAVSQPPALSNGAHIEVKGSITNGVLKATTITIQTGS